MEVHWALDPKDAVRFRAGLSGKRDCSTATQTRIPEKHTNLFEARRAVRGGSYASVAQRQSGPLVRDWLQVRLLPGALYAEMAELG